MAEGRQLGPDLGPYVQWGPGRDFQMQNPTVAAWIDDVFLPARWLTYRSVWARADFLSCPQASPPGHGAIAYCETDLIWEAGDLERGCGMFPYFAPPSYFDAAPKGF